MRDVLDLIFSVPSKTLVVERHLRHRDHDVGLVAVRAKAFDRAHGLVALEPPTAIGRAVRLGAVVALEHKTVLFSQTTRQLAESARHSRGKRLEALATALQRLASPALALERGDDQR